MRLLKVLHLAPLAPLIAGAVASGRVMRGEAAEMPLRLRHKRVMVDAARGGKDHVGRGVMRADETAEVVFAKRADPFSGAEDRATDGLAGIGGFLEPVEDDVVRRVQRLPDLLQDHAALQLDLGFLKGRTGENVADYVERQRSVFGQHAGVIGRRLAGRVGVQVAADILDLFRDGEGRPARRALERHMLEKMGDAVLGLRLIPAARSDPDADGGGAEAGHVFGDDAEPVGEGREADGHARARSLIWA